MTRRLNTIRLFVLSGIFIVLLFLPLFHLYQAHRLSHSHEKLPPTQKFFYDSFDRVMTSISDHPAELLDQFKGNVWSGTVFNQQLSDPLSVVSQTVAEKNWVWSFALTALIPVVATLLLGRFFCGWICPAALLFEMVDNTAALLQRNGIQIKQHRLPVYTKYAILGVGLLLTAIFGYGLVTYFYPPAVIGREIHYVATAVGFSIGTWLIILALLFDVLVVRRGFCRYLCPGGALYALLGKFRLLRIQRQPDRCNDCRKCHGICQYELNPMRDQFGMECNQCTACISVCATDALKFEWRWFDRPDQGPGLLGNVSPSTSTQSAQFVEVQS